MGKLFSACIHSFPLRGHTSSSLNIDYATGFCSSLSVDLEKLAKSLARNSVSLRWSAEAMILLKKLHVKLLLLIEESELPISWDGEGWLDQYMKETLMLLDFCNLLKSTIFEINRYQLLIDFTVRKLYDYGSNVAVNKTEIERLEMEGKRLHSMKKRRDVRWDKMVVPEYKFKSKRCINIVMYAVQSTVIIISLLLLSAIISPVPINMDKEVRNEFPQLKSLSYSLRTLVCCFHERISRPREDPRSALLENDMIETVVADLKAQVDEGVVEDREKFIKSVDSLRERSVALKEGMEMFDSVVSDVFEEVTKGRNRVLEMLSSSNVS